MNESCVDGRLWDIFGWDLRWGEVTVGRTPKGNGGSLETQESVCRVGTVEVTCLDSVGEDGVGWVERTTRCNGVTTYPRLWVTEFTDLVGSTGTPIVHPYRSNYFVGKHEECRTRPTITILLSFV